MICIEVTSENDQSNYGYFAFDQTLDYRVMLWIRHAILKHVYTPFNIQVSASEDYGKDVSHVEILIKSFDTFLQSVQEFEIKINRVVALGQGKHDKVFQKTVLEQQQKTVNNNKSGT